MTKVIMVDNIEMKEKWWILTFSAAPIRCSLSPSSGLSNSLIVVSIKDEEDEE